MQQEVRPAIVIRIERRRGFWLRHRPRHDVLHAPTPLPQSQTRPQNLPTATSCIVVPLSRAAIATVALFAFTYARMDFINPLIYLHDESQYTLAIGLQSFLGRHQSEWTLLMATATVMTLPMLILFFLAQRTFIRGIALTGMKG